MFNIQLVIIKQPLIQLPVIQLLSVQLPISKSPILSIQLPPPRKLNPQTVGGPGVLRTPSILMPIAFI